MIVSCYATSCSSRIPATKALTKKQYIDDLEIDEEGAGDILMDENKTANVARPGTSFERPQSQMGGAGNPPPIMRPMSKSGRPLTGFARPGSNRPTSSSSGNRLDTALAGNRPGTTRPITAGGRYIRLGTASLQSMGGQFIAVDKLNMKAIASKKAISKAICDYLIYVEHNPKKALELAAEATVVNNFNDWWWKVRLGKCYFQLGLYREAEKQFTSALKTEDVIGIHLELSRIYVRLDQPNTAIDLLNRALTKYPHEISLILNISRIYDMLNDAAKGVEFYKRILAIESCNLEAVASIASYHFYIDQPEVALRFYKRLVQLGVNTAEIWNNLALCCFYDSQYDMFYTCIEKALMLADDSNMAEIWYNISHVAIAVGDFHLAYQALKVTLNYEPTHAEAYNNLAVLEVKRDKPEAAKHQIEMAIKNGEFLFEPAYNGALLAYKSNDYQESYQLVTKALRLYPEHADSQELLKMVESVLSVMQIQEQGEIIFIVYF
eukprot:TRINITY_DN7821_c0_g2_i4.p1 TRINITY_DN7821_c0_g2~~TRINITY_DN7821_c0_g2_i4.p1  ORF type:complete len:494 (-),score=70.15 TRINITY_DN7821_c0_g2_i4:38-1519(-)